MMKTVSKILAAIATVLSLMTAVSCAKYDDDINDLRSRVGQLESQLNGLKGNISGLQTAVSALQNNVFVTSVTESADGWQIKFSNGKTAELHNGVSPVIAVKQGEDSRWYWTVNGEWLKDSGGKRVPTTGADGANGTNGTNGTDGVTPQMKIEGDYWFVSVDNGASWTQVGKAKGADGDSFFSSVTYDDHSVTLTLKDGTPIVLGRGANGVQAIQVVPDYSDGSVRGKAGAFDLRFDIIPARATASVGALANECFTVNAVYTMTKANVGDVIALPVTAKSVSNGKLILTVDGSGLNSLGVLPQISVNAALVIDDGTNAVTSSYFELCNVQEVNLKYEGVSMGYGLKWASRNLGADRPEDIGLMLGWAVTEPTTRYYWSDYKWIQEGKETEDYITKYTFPDLHTAGCWYDENTVFIGDNKTRLSDYDYADDPARQLWGSTWRVPSPEDWAKLMDPTDYTWTWDQYRRGYIVTCNLSPYTGNQIFLPATGGLLVGIWVFQDTRGYYWTNALSTYPKISSQAQVVVLRKDGSRYIEDNYRVLPFAIRPVTNE